MLDHQWQDDNRGKKQATQNLDHPIAKGSLERQPNDGAEPLHVRTGV